MADSSKDEIGCYKYVVLLICGLAIVSVSSPGSWLAEARYNVPCDIDINYDRQLKINFYTFAGLLCKIIIVFLMVRGPNKEALITGALIIGIISDLSSRLKPLVISLILYGSATLGLGFCTGYYCFAFFSILRAFWVSSLLTVTAVYVAEIQTPRHRGPSLCCLQIFWLFGVISMPALSISWRVSHFIFGTLALLVAILVSCFLVESPRLLLSLGKEEAAIKSLRKIYRRNNFLKREAEYPVKKLIDDFSPESKNHINLLTYVPKALFRPSWYSIFVVLQIQFFFNLCYFTMSYWFRAINYRNVILFPILHQTECSNLGKKYVPADPAAANLIGSNEKHEPSNAPASGSNSSCISNSSDMQTADYYKEVLIVALGTVPMLIWMILRLDHLGRSYFTTISHVVGGLLSFFIHYLIGTKYYLAYTCTMESMWIVSATASTCLVTEIFKTRTRVLGVGLANSFGYVGMALGIYGSLFSEGANCIFVISITGIFATGRLGIIVHLKTGNHFLTKKKD